MTIPKARISEIFPSIQGEGQYAGIPQVFVRFFECHMHCVWCDTPASIGDTSRNFTEMDLDQVFDRVSRLGRNFHSISLTGGEPLLQKDFIKELLDLMKRARMPSYLETNGILFENLKDIIEGIDIVAMDIKLPSSTKCQSYWAEHREFLKVARQKEVFVKAVVTRDTDRTDIVQAVELMTKVDPRIVFILQPNSYELRNGVLARCREFQDYCLPYLPNTRILPQMHKFLKIP